MSLSAVAISTGVAKAVSDAEWESRKREAMRRNRKRAAGSVIMSSTLAGGMGAAINTGTRNRVVGGLGSAGITGVAGGIAAANRQRKLRRRIRDNDAALRASYERAKEQGLIKADDTKKKDKTKEATFGVANNVLSAAMGTYGAKAVYNQARDKQAAEGKMSPRKVKAPKTPKEPGRLMRVVRRAGNKVPAPVKRYAPHAAVAGAVGSQLFNVAGDVQAASYFARDLAANKKGKKVQDERRTDVGKADLLGWGRVARHKAAKHAAELEQTNLSRRALEMARREGEHKKEIREAQDVARSARRELGKDKLKARSGQRDDSIFGVAGRGINRGLGHLSDERAARAQADIRNARLERIRARRGSERAHEDVVREFHALNAARSRAKKRTAVAGAGVTGTVGVGAVGTAKLRQIDRRNRARREQAEIGKAYRNFDSEDRRKHRLGLYQGVGLTAGGAATAAGIKRLKDTSNLSADRLKSIMARHKQTGALLATGAALTGAGAAAGRKAKKERDRSPWT